MKLLWLVLNGMLIGISNIIPGVSGGTMTVSLGIYDDFIFSITHLFKNKKKSVKFLLPLGVGIVIGVLCFSYAIEFLLFDFPFITALIFVDLFLFFVLFIIGFSLMQEPTMDSFSITFSLEMILILFVLGVIASVTMIVPGVSGSLVLMILGYYYQLIQLLNQFSQNVLTLNWV